ncbi:Pentatricopeptide repeat-containing protein [Acorus calamus]|uniref:Pentatricopeptide repeat-containing protein n=1 Tax=Acorus calamus TaxID=4465 RepID=A0AAV9EHT7_ACOCL|nr:Pentatricopeptide repeat-containing protein [Acorus calamus]
MQAITKSKRPCLLLLKHSLLLLSKPSSSKSLPLHPQATHLTKTAYGDPLSKSPLFVVPHRNLCSHPQIEVSIDDFLKEKPDSDVTHETVLYVLKKLDKNPSKALRFFQWVSAERGFKPSPATYGVMLRMLGRKETMKEFWVLLKQMREQGMNLDRETLTSLVIAFKKEKMASDAECLKRFFENVEEINALENRAREVVEVMSSTEWGEEVEKKLDEMKLCLSDGLVLKVLSGIGKYPLKGLEFFNWVRKTSDYEPNSVTYNAVLRVLAREESIEQFWRVIDEMKGEGFEVDIDTYIKLMRRFEKLKLMEEAVSLYEIMMRGPCKLSIGDCGRLLRSIASSKDPNLDLVSRVVRIYEEGGYSLSKSVYDGIHRSLVSVGRFDEAETMLARMRDAGYEADNITYSQLVFGLCKAGRFDEACKILDEMECCGCVPDIMTWTILIQGHCVAGEVDGAVACFGKMLDKGCDADADVIEVLVNGLCGKSRVSSAYTLVIEMIERTHARPWQATYKHLIEKLLGECKLEEAMKLVKFMKIHNLPPFTEPVVRYISKFGTVEDALDLLKLLTGKSFPSVSTYLHLFKAFFNEGRHSEAQDLLYKSPHHVCKHSDILHLFGSRKDKKSI